mmetsp:Transcript_75514/g.133720  ORF Transcript_75514/g.133720 Transcript_75514/m.133720 type:complete len:115 (-) Transcript_75514:317-661(-)
MNALFVISTNTGTANDHCAKRAKYTGRGPPTAKVSVCMTPPEHSQMYTPQTNLMAYSARVKPGSPTPGNTTLGPLALMSRMICLLQEVATTKQVSVTIEEKTSRIEAPACHTSS